MAYNDIINRTDADALIPEEVSREIIQDIPTRSAVMSLGRRMPNLSRAQQRIPVLDVLPHTYFLNGDTDLKQTTDQAWADKFFDVAELACIVPIPEAVLDDADYDIWAQVKPRIVESMGQAFDAAVLVGTNAPTAWPDDLLTAAAAASQTLDYSTHIATPGNDMYSALLGESGIISLIEADGFMATGHIAVMSMRGKLRDARDGVGQPLFKRSMTNGQNMQDATRYDLDGAPIYFLDNNAVSAATALMFAGQWDQLLWAVRQDITYKVLTEAVITDGSGNIVYNLAQQDMIALRAVMRLAWQVPNPVKLMNETEATRYPFSVLVP